MTDTPDVDGPKELLRRRMSAWRKGLSAERRDAAARKLNEQGIRALGGFPFEVLATYWPIANELDPGLLRQSLVFSPQRTALPVVVGPGEPMIFRAWQPGESLVRGKPGFEYPDASAAAVEPDLILVPLLAFDRNRHRLGFGAGYYDMTLAAIRARRRVIAVGIGYAEQEVPEVPIDSWDEPLDLILTETGAI